MIENNSYKTLDEVILKYPIILFDTSALCGACPNKNESLGFLASKKIELEEQLQFMELLKKHIEKGTSYLITPLVAEEFLSGNYNYKKAIRIGEVHRNKRVLELCRKTREVSRMRKSLIDFFEENNRILELTRHEQSLYDAFFTSHSGFLNYEIRKTSLDFFISGIVISKTRRFVALACNNFNIARVWRYILRGRESDIIQLGFIVRKGVNSFEVLY